MPCTVFKHKELEKFFLQGAKIGIQAKHAIRLKIILGRLNASIAPQDMDLPNLKLHELAGKRELIAIKASRFTVTECQ